MTRPVDEKIVKMRIDNQDFKTKADETLGILGRINQSFGRKNVDIGGMNHLESSVDRIAGRFSNLGIIGVTALQNITNKAIDAGTKIVKAMTIAPVKEGFSEYELKLNSVQTIMAGTGEDLKSDAIVTREASAPKGRAPVPRLEFQGEFLHAWVNEERVRSDQPVTLKRGADTFTADSMDYDNLEQVMQLRGRVRGTLMPAPVRR